MEPISAVAAGWYIRGEHFDTVYYVDQDMLRHPFWDAKTFRTWSDWDQVIWVTDATLASLKISTPMAPKPGTVLVKIEGGSSVYAIGANANGNPVLHKIPTEAIAKALYGNDWADYVIDISPTMLEILEYGDDYTTQTSVDVNLLKKRETLH